jgi:protein-disulfide isomerase
MKFKNMTTGLLLFIIIIAGVLVSASGGVAGGAQISTTSAQNSKLELSPFKGPSTAPVVITVFSDFQ